MSFVRLVVLITWFASTASAHERRPHPRATRATGIALTVMGAINLALVGVFAGVYYSGKNCSPDCTDGSTIAAASGIAGMAIAGILGSALLSVGIPLIVLAKKPAAPTVQLAPTGVRLTF